MAEGMDMRLRAIERKLGITEEQETYQRMVEMAQSIHRLQMRIDQLEQRMNGGPELAMNTIGRQAATPYAEQLSKLNIKDRF